jgi:hypothetical protein
MTIVLHYLLSHSTATVHQDIVVWQYNTRWYNTRECYPNANRLSITVLLFRKSLKLRASIHPSFATISVANFACFNCLPSSYIMCRECTHGSNVATYVNCVFVCHVYIFWDIVNNTRLPHKKFPQPDRVTNQKPACPPPQKHHQHIKKLLSLLCTLTIKYPKSVLRSFQIYKWRLNVLHCSTLTPT